MFLTPCIRKAPAGKCESTVTHATTLFVLQWSCWPLPTPWVGILLACGCCPKQILSSHLVDTNRALPSDVLTQRASKHQQAYPDIPTAIGLPTPYRLTSPCMFQPEGILQEIHSLLCDWNATREWPPIFCEARCFKVEEVDACWTEVGLSVIPPSHPNVPRGSALDRTSSLSDNTVSLTLYQTKHRLMHLSQNFPNNEDGFGW